MSKNLYFEKIYPFQLSLEQGILVYLYIWTAIKFLKVEGAFRQQISYIPLSWVN